MRMPARPESRPRAQPRRAHLRNASADVAADEDAVTFIKRTLCPAGDPKDDLLQLLPPFTSSNRVDVSLYAWVAVLLHQFVQTWYNRITPDSQFVSEVVLIIAHCTRGLESRLRHLDMESLLADEVPLLVTQHIQAVRVAKTSHAPRLIVHGLHAHVALAPPPVDPESCQAQAESEVAYCQLLISRVLPLLLPHEDLGNPCLDALVSELMSQTILYNAICGKVSEPWLLWDAIAKVVPLLRPQLGNENGCPAQLPRDRGPMHRLTGLFWSLVDVVMLARIFLWVFFDALRHATTRLPKRPVIKTLPQKRAPLAESGSSQQVNVVERRPFAEMGIWTCISEVLLLRQRMPWLTGTTAYLQWVLLYGPGKLCGIDGPLDRLLCAAFHTRVMPAVSHALPSLLRSARLALFPNNSLASGRPIPSVDEILAIKHNAVDAITAAIPVHVRHMYFATKDVQSIAMEVEAGLELLDDQYLNKHLIISLIDLLAVRLFPELTTAEGT